MSGGLNIPKQVKTFDLLLSPFNILGVEPSASLEQVAEAYDDAVADEAAAESDLTDAREILMNPRQRIPAELSFLLDTQYREVKVLLDALKRNASLDDIVRIADRLAPLSKANLLVHAASHKPANADLLFALVDAHAHIKSEYVHARLEVTRKKARLVVPTLETVQEELHELISVHSRAVLAAYQTSTVSAAPVEECTRRVLASADADRIDALEGLVRAFGSKIAPDLSQIEEEIKSAARTISTSPKEISLVGPIEKNLRNWSALARPLLELDAHKGRDEERARQLYVDVRNVSIDLANKHNSFDVALSITKAAADAFKLLPRATEQLEEDLTLLEERSAEANVIPLQKWIEELYENYSILVKDLEHHGFGEESVRETKELWDHFAFAAKKTRLTKAADLPWLMVRSLAIAISNEESSPQAAKALLDGMFRFAESIAPSEKISDMLREDVRSLERNIREKKLVEDIKANRVSAALAEIYELLKSPQSPEERETLNKLKHQLEGKRTARFLKWGAVAVVGGIIIYSNISEKSPSSNGRPSYQAPTYQTPSYQTPTDAARSVPVSPPVQNSQALIELKPSAGSVGNVFSQPNIRYCSYQKVRLKALGEVLRGNDEINRFNALVDDYNSWCGHFRYYERDLQTVTAEVTEKSAALAAEGRSIASGWRASYTQVPAARDSVEPSLNTRAPQSIPSPDSNDSAYLSPNGPTPADVDLLEIDTSTNTQKRLNELGYFRGPVNGVWGPQSRNSLRLFKKANGLPDDDALDALTASRLFSSSAVRGQPQAKGTATQAATSETTYPPPPGAMLNPLNRQDAMTIHAKLRELGFYRANSATLWSAASREALKEFKIRNDLNNDDRWDAATEQRLLSASPAIATADIDAGFAAATGGTWSIDTRSCPGAAGGSDALPMTIAQKRAVTDGAYCEFSEISGQGTNWKALGTCVVNGETRKSNISLVRTGDVLVWSSKNGTTKYFRCSN